MAFQWDAFDGDGYSWTPLEREGDTARWHSRWQISVPEASPFHSAADVLATVDASIEKGITWRPVEVKWERTGRNVAADESRWAFRDKAGARWAGRSHVAAEAGRPRTYLLDIEVHREATQ